MGKGCPGPDDESLAAELGDMSSPWTDLVGYIASRYDHEPVMPREGRDRTWTIRYRKGGRMLVTLYPGKGGSAVLVVLGKEEVAKATGARLSERVSGTFKTAKRFHDGRWLWVRPSTRADIESIATLLAAKRRPNQP